MPVNKLFVEGTGGRSLDAPLMNAVFNAGGLNIIPSPAGSKYDLKSAVIYVRKVNRTDDIYYIRDKDFDYDVDTSNNTPQEIKHRFEQNQNEKLVGWYWCRHEIENYLLEPSIISAKFKKPITDVKNALSQAAISIRIYEAARWTIGFSKRKGMLPPFHILSTKHSEDFILPKGWSEEQCLEWAITSSNEFMGRVDTALNKKTITERFYQYYESFTKEKCADVNWILHTFSGKDLFAAMAPWLKVQHPNDVIPSIRLWMTENAQDVLGMLDEWKAFIEILKNI